MGIPVLEMSDRRPVTFWMQVRNAAAAGTVVGVKWAMALLIMLASLAMFLGDYQVLRQRAANGQRAFEFIQQQIEQARAKPAALPSLSRER